MPASALSRGTRSRSGNAMGRTRAAILDAAETCIAQRGLRKTTMSDVATAGQVAKATLYNHFRTKEDLLAGLRDTRLGELRDEAVAAAGQHGLAAGLAHAASWLGAREAVHRLAVVEPAALAPLVVPGEGEVWSAARDAVAGLLRAGGAEPDAASVHLVLRWLLGHLSWAGAADEVDLGAQALASALGGGRSVVPVATTPEVRDPAPEETVPQLGAAAGLGWPG